MSGFNLDLNRIETELQSLAAQAITLGHASDFNQARQTGAQVATVYVLPLDERYQDADVLTGLCEQQLFETFAVMCVVPCHGGNRVADGQVNTLRDRVKAALSGLVIDDWEPITPDRGRLVEFNRQTNNLIYQCQFKTSRTVRFATRSAT